MSIRFESPYRLFVLGFITAVGVYLFFLEPWGHDTWFHVLRLLDVASQVEDGRYYVHFASNTAQGKGLPVWIYYSQWIYWPAMLLMFLGASPLVALKIVYCALLLVCAAGCYLLLRVESDENTAAFGTLLFVTSNYVIGEVSQRSAYAEFWSVAFLPLLLLAMNSCVVGRKRGSAVAVAVLAALMILAHPLSFMNSGLAIAAYALYMANRSHVPYHRLLGIVPHLVLALGLTAFYWLPAVLETRYVGGAGGVPRPIQDTFLDLWAYLNFTGPTNLGPVLTVLFPMVAACVLFWREAHDGAGRWSSWPLLAGVLGYVFLTLPISEPLYAHVPFLASNLWVWRVLFQITLLAVIFITPRLRALPSRLLTQRNFAIVAAVCILQAAAFILWNTAGYLSFRPVKLSEIDAHLEYERNQTDDFGVDEYLPNPPAQRMVGDECQSFRSIAPDDAYGLTFQIAPGQTDVCVRIARFWNTRYSAIIAGEEIPVYADTEGEIVIVPGGRAGVAEVRYSQPSYVILAIWISVSACVVLLILGFAAVTRRRDLTGGPRTATQSG